MMMDERYDYLLPLHDALKEIVSDFSDICQNAGVSFYLFYGTLLGAARHHDIIPWDDDIDLCMIRSDYEKLINYFINNTVPGYSLYCAETSDKHTQIFAKLVRTDGRYNALRRYFTHEKGLSIDIFPLDEARPNSNFHQMILGAVIVHLRRIVNSRAKLHNSDFHEKTIKRIFRALMVFPFLAINNHALLVFTNSLCKKGNGKGYPNIISYSTTIELYKENEQKECWFPSSYLPLGDKQYKVPGKYDVILTHLYGKDWNEMPSDSVKEQHSYINNE